jgi:thiopurine S-methyltransferase
MDTEFWLQRWHRNEIGFHQPEPNPLLTAHWSKLSLPYGSRVCVPMCGKSVDLCWLRERGHEVIGVELSPLAATAFAAENRIAMQVEGAGAFEIHRADRLSILVGDFFDLGPVEMQGVTAVYDRAALVALPLPLRSRYVRHLRRLLGSGTQTLLVTFEYDQAQMDGPPFAVDAAEVHGLYGAGADIEELVRQDILEQEPRFRARGLTRLSESAYRITQR